RAWRGAAAGLMALWALAGCGSMGQDLSEFGESLTPVTPPEAARMMVDPHDPDNRRAGIVLISNSPFGGADAYLAVYRDRVANETDPLAKAASITALGRYGGPDDAPAIAACLQDEQFQVRWEAAKALQRLHHPEVVADLLRILRNDREQPDIRVAAAVALGQYPQDRVFQGLVEALDAPELAVNAAARRSLSTLTGQDHGLYPAVWLSWYNAAEEPFEGQQEYLFPTYQRQETWLEKLAFWSTKTFEQPAPPAGLRPPPRRTYQDEEVPANETGG
ncbi:MAG: HEAT repeat domain-containing protein, partial [Planctomycetota bacterium]